MSESAVTARARPPLPPGPYLVIGLARSGAAAALALRDAGIEVRGSDAGEPAGAAQLAGAGVAVAVRDDGVALLDGARAVIKSPGVPAEAAAISAARRLGLPVMGELELAWRLLPNEFIAVTGTNGKTTTTELIGHIHRAAGRPVAVAGNVGAAVSGLAGEVGPDAVIVCECSSFQLEDTLEFAPEAAVLLNLAPDHLDRHGTLEAYLQAKRQGFARQRAEDLAVLPPELLEAVAPHARTVLFGAEEGDGVRSGGGWLHWRGDRLLEIAELGLRGAHNVQNAMAAAAVCLERGVEREAVIQGLRTFPGVKHRLEEVARRGGVAYVNDSKATNVASTVVALSALSEPPAGGLIHLILGGRGKGQDFSPLREPVERACRAVYLIGEDASAIAAALDGARAALHQCGDLERALEAAAAAARAGETVLLSPGCASFDQYADFEARGERFRELVQALR